LWAELAKQHDGHDRWYLEALGIGADGDWDACLATWLKTVGSTWKTPAGRDIVWRSRSSSSAEYLAQILEDPETTSADAPRYLRAFDFLRGPEKDRALVKLAFSESHPEGSPIHELVAAESLARLEPRAVLENRSHHMALSHLVESTSDPSLFLTLIEKLDLCGYASRLLAVAQANSENDLGVRAMRALLGQHEEPCILAALHGADPRQLESTIRALGNSADRRSVPILVGLADDEKYSLDVRRQAVRAAGNTRWGASALLDRLRAGKLNAGLRGAASAALHGSAAPDIRAAADKLFPLPPAFDARPLPSIHTLSRRRGNATQGRIVFATVGTCSKCHVVNGEGKDVGPNLSEIGAKLSRAALYESILFPSAGISHNFATYTAVLEGGNVVTGILVNRTRDSIAIKGSDAITRTYKASDVEELKEQPVSLMPADLQKLMTAEDLVNVVEYLTSLRPKSNLGRTARVNPSPRASLAP
jgi:putative heme-binding domain-containing protein